MNVAGEDMGDLMKILEEKYPPDVNELGKAGLTEAGSEVVTPPRIKEAIGWIECKFEKLVEFGAHIWIAGKVVSAGVRDNAWDGVLKPETAHPLTHISREYFAVDMVTRTFERAKK